MLVGHRRTALASSLCDGQATLYQRRISHQRLYSLHTTPYHTTHDTLASAVASLSSRGVSCVASRRSGPPPKNKPQTPSRCIGMTYELL